MTPPKRIPVIPPELWAEITPNWTEVVGKLAKAMGVTPVELAVLGALEILRIDSTMPRARDAAAKNRARKHKKRLAKLRPEVERLHRMHDWGAREIIRWLESERRRHEPPDGETEPSAPRATRQLVGEILRAMKRPK